MNITNVGFSQANLKLYLSNFTYAIRISPGLSNQCAPSFGQQINVATSSLFAIRPMRPFIEHSCDRYFCVNINGHIGWSE